MNSQHQPEFDLRQDWERLSRNAGAVLRYPRLILLVTLACAALSWLFTMTRDPVFRASATLKLEDPRERNPVLKGYDIPLGVTEVEEALSILRSQALMERVVAAPTDGAVANPEHPEWMYRLGLTTLIDDETQRPLRAALTPFADHRSNDFRVYGFVDAKQPDAPAEVRLRFLDARRVVVSLVSPGPGLEWARDEPTLIDFKEGRPIVAHGMTFRLVLRGRPDGRTFLMRHLAPEVAARHFMARVRIDKLANQQGLLRVTVLDMDPGRAAAVANALCQAYLAHDRAEVLAKADSNVALIEGQLTELRSQLDQVEAVIAETLVDNPDALDPGTAGGALLARQTAGQAQVARLASLKIQLGEMLAALVRGARAEVSRIGPELDDRFVQMMLEDVVVLERDLANVGRKGMGDYKKSIRIIRDQKLDSLDDVRDKYQALDDIVTKLEAGDATALARLGGEQAKDGSIAIDFITRQYLAELGTQHAKMIELEQTYVEGYELVELQQQRIAELEADVLSFLRSQRDGLGERMAQVRATAERWSDLVAEHPGDERAQIEAGLSDLWRRIGEGIASRLRGVEAELELVTSDLETVETRLRTLPLAERELASPMGRRDSLRIKVDEWTRDRAQVAFAREGVLDAARMLDRATRPAGRTGPVASFGLLVGLICGLILSLGGAIVWDGFKGKPRSAPELEEATGLPVCAVVPSTPRGVRGPGWLALREDPDGPIAEAYRTLRARLRGLEVRGRELRTVGVTSCLAGEGKTAANAGLAMAFALEGRRVLLIDGNLRTPGIADAFEQAASPGLAEALDGRRHWLQSRRPSAHRGLDILTAGAHYYSPGDLLGSPEMEALLDDASTEYDLVVIDLPHVQGLPDVPALAPRLDALLLLHCTASGPTSQTLRRTARELIRGGAALAGVVQVSAAQRSGPRLRRVA
jgi:Mrp family chromosome partitioning ATPase/uncharacterized protein involved in exopolysaccharide biosynthesis